MEANGSAMSSGAQDVDAGSAEEVEEQGSAELLYHNIFQISWSNIDDDSMWLGQCVRCKAWCCGSAGMIRHIESTPPATPGVLGSARMPGCLDEGDEVQEIPEHMERLVTFHLDEPDEVEPAEPDDPSEYLVSCRTCTRVGHTGVLEADNLEMHFEEEHADWKDDVGEGWTRWPLAPWPLGSAMHVVYPCSSGRHQSAAMWVSRDQITGHRSIWTSQMGVATMPAELRNLDEPDEGRSTRRRLTEAPVAAEGDEEVDPEEVD